VPDFFNLRFAAALAATPAFAQGNVGLGVGSSSFSGFDRSNGVAVFTGGSASKSSTKILGGYQMTPNWGVEAQYTALGNRAITVTPFKQEPIPTGQAHHNLAFMEQLPCLLMRAFR
jgi:hypothetical protein